MEQVTLTPNYKEMRNIKTVFPTPSLDISTNNSPRTALHRQKSEA